MLSRFNFDVHGVCLQRERIDFLLLLSHFLPDMLRHSCCDLAAASIIASLRMQAGPAAADAAAARMVGVVEVGRARACAGQLWAILEAGVAGPLSAAVAASSAEVTGLVYIGSAAA